MHTYPINEYIAADSDLFAEIHQIVADNAPKVAQLSGKYLSQSEIQAILSEMTQTAVDSSLHVNLPFYSDFGRHIRFGKNVFINTGVMMTDLGGITIEDDVLIAPRVNIITVNHPEAPSKRRGIILKPVYIKKKAWIGAGATILAGVTVGENAIVAAGSIVSKDVPNNSIVAGVPAKVIRQITFDNVEDGVYAM